MKEVVDALKAVVGELVTFLRYLAAPLVAALVVWLADEDHNIFYFAGNSGTGVGTQAAWFWIVLASLALLGISAYSFHRAVIVPFIGKHIHKQLPEGKDQPTVDDLSFARWKRRAAKIDTPDGMAQKVLDQANAAGDFLY